MIRLLAVVLVLAGAAEAHAQRAVVAMVPGSGFNGAKASYVSRMSFGPDVWEGAGHQTIPVPYRRGKPGLKDVVNGVILVRNRFPSSTLCLYGESSGGTWALQAAARLPDLVDCVVVVSGVTDQETLAASPYRLARHLGREVWPGYFGPTRSDSAFEPFDTWSSEVPDVPLLLAYAKADRIVPAQQGELLAEVVPHATLRVLDPGPRRFAHARAHAGQFVRTRAEAVALVDAQTTSP